jgi:probable HAF family extracellular repeat protein
MQRHLTLALAAVVLAACRDGAQPVAPTAEVAAALAGSAGLEYQWIPLDTRGDGFRSSALAINNHNQVVGWASPTQATPCEPGVPCPPPPSHAALWDNGIMQDLGTLGGENSQATAINERGQVVGWSTLPDGSRHAFFWDNGAMHDLGAVGLFPTYRRVGLVVSSSVAINERGQVIGNRPEGGAFLWGDGVNQPLPLDFATGINNRGQVVGWLMQPDAGGVLKLQAALWEDGVVTQLGTLGGDESWAVAISDNGWVAGNSLTERRPWRGTFATFTLPFRWKAGRMEELGGLVSETVWPALPFVSNRGTVVVVNPLGCPTSVWDNGAWQLITRGCSYPQGMNGQGAITGSLGSFGAGRAFVWQDGVLGDLGTGQGDYSRGHGINASGAVAGHTGVRAVFNDQGVLVPSRGPWAAIWVPAQTVVVTVPQGVKP